MSDDVLEPDEVAIWHAFKRMGESVSAAVERDILAASGLTGPEFGVLTRLVDLGDGRLRQQELATSMRWDKSRLSHQITRMQKRDLVSRNAVDASTVMVEITDAGRDALVPARPAHAESIRAHLLDRLDERGRAEFAAAMEAILGD
ncbi:MarR family winged helix-turn-helix transcriptional regulator [Williamsia serinedens]|uniref:DNA-binding transcriptional regulator, MarR family n=1 Tax=Williamsia serinedens TaxID=391736 RepID=A0ABT1H1H9_9NOCA|nr:MarR family winged helix-turn-helix transcriptional regulator [Williamsia serinedens]MCP2161102.1 DNA-binding transcriptional regulator, MarR family [Williamsia serinedens]